MLDPMDELAELLRDAQAHARWLADAKEHVVLKPAAVPTLIRPGATQASRPVTASAPVRSLSQPPRAAQPAAPVAPVKAPPAPAPIPVVARSGSGSVDPGSQLITVREQLGECTRCKLCKGRKTIVFGVGNPKAELVFVGEGPGENEDLQGEPFVGAAGQLLDKMIQAMGLSREQVYICNVVKCRPPGNRNPEPDEIAACEPFLHAQLDAIQPKVVVALGKFAAQTLLREETAISRLRGQWRTYRGIKLMPTFHPSYLLRSPSEKKHAWADLQQVMKELGLTPPARS